MAVEHSLPERATRGGMESSAAHATPRRGQLGVHLDGRAPAARCAGAVQVEAGGTLAEQRERGAARQAARPVVHEGIGFQFTDAVLGTRVVLRRALQVAQVYDLVLSQPGRQLFPDVGAAVVGHQHHRQHAALAPGALQEPDDVGLGRWWPDREADRARRGDVAQDLGLQRLPELVPQEMRGVERPHGVSGEDVDGSALPFPDRAQPDLVLRLQLGQCAADEPRGLSRKDSAHRLLTRAPAAPLELASPHTSA